MIRKRLHLTCTNLPSVRVLVKHASDCPAKSTLVVIVRLNILGQFSLSCRRMGR